VGLTLML
jgi:hypothetical protein